MAARVLDDALPADIGGIPTSYDISIGGRTVKIRASTALAGVMVGAALLGKLPMSEYLLPMAAGALAFESTAEVGDDLAAALLGLPMPGAPTPELPPPATSYPQQYYPDAYMQQALYGLRQY
jgi:hypothetical protein